MKTLLFILLLSATITHANTYYVSASGNDTNKGTSPASPFKTITKVNAIFDDLRPGDQVLFKRGDTFYGQLLISQSGSEDKPITIGAYGTGAKPVITGFTVVPTWTQIDKNIWESTVLSDLAAVNMLTINGVEYAMGRYPNADVVNKGYLTIDSHEGSSSISDKTLANIPDWTGGTIVMRINHWTLDYATITAQSNGTLTYDKAPSKEPTNGFGYFVENHPATLDQFGEWYYDPHSKKVRIYFNNQAPTRYTVKVSTLDQLITIKKQDNISFDGIRIDGANDDGFLLNGTNGITITNCDIWFCGDDGINARQNNNQGFTAENNSISDCGNFGFNLQLAGKGQVIRNNSIRRIGLFPGMGGTGGQSRIGIISNGTSNKLIEGNRIDSIGYAGIRFGGNDVTVQQNVISNFTLTVDDGGGIYTANQNGREKSNRKILNNLVYNGIGAKEGTPKAKVQQSSGIYIDDNSAGVEVAGNSVWNCNKTGLYVHNAYNLNIHNNTFYNNATQVVFTHDNDRFPTLTNVVFQHNTCYSKTEKQPVVNFATKNDDIANFGTVDSNYYLSPDVNAQPIVAVTGLYQRGAQQKTKHTPDSWKGSYGFDAHSKYMQKASTDNALGSVRFEYNETTVPRSLTLDRTYTDAADAVYRGTVVLQPYSSLLLFPSENSAASASNSNAAPGAERSKHGALKKH